MSTARVKVVAYYENKIAGYDMSDGDFTIKGEPYRYVSKSGGNVFPYSLPEWAATTIQDAVDAGVPGDTIIVAGDTYYQVDHGRQLPCTCYGGWNATFTVRDPETVRHDDPGGREPRHVHERAAGPCGIEGFTLKNGSGTFLPLPRTGMYGGAILSYQSSPVIKHNVIDSCGVATCSTSAAAAESPATAAPPSSRETDRSAAALSAAAASTSTNRRRRSENNRIAGCSPNTEYSGAKHGGGVYALHSTAALEGNTIENNDGYRKGGGVYLYLSPASSNGTRSPSTTDSTRAAAYAPTAPPSRSPARSCGRTRAPSSGGGIYQRAGSIDISNCIVASEPLERHRRRHVRRQLLGRRHEQHVRPQPRQVTAAGTSSSPPNAFAQRENNLFTYGAKNGFQANNMNDIILPVQQLLRQHAAQHR